jgi:hypothetical protein
VSRRTVQPGDRFIHINTGRTVEAVTVATRDGWVIVLDAGVRRRACIATLVRAESPRRF